jgi:hypothetical protein
LSLLVLVLVPSLTPAAAAAAPSCSDDDDDDDDDGGSEDGEEDGGGIGGKRASRFLCKRFLMVNKRVLVSSREVSATAHAAPKPAANNVFSVPARLPFSCPAPYINFTKGGCKGGGGGGGGKLELLLAVVVLLSCCCCCCCFLL